MNTNTTANEHLLSLGGGNNIQYIKEDDICIYIIIHNLKANIPVIDGYVPLFVGFQNKKISYDGEFCRDDEGDSISDKNNSYCELTGLYWIWKNSPSKYIGLVHYRRFFVSWTSKLEHFLHFHFGIPKNPTYKYVSKDRAIKLMDKYDLIVKRSKLYPFENVWKTLTRLFPLERIKNLQNIVYRLYPNYANSFDKCMKMRTLFDCNMFIGKHEVIAEYCEWLFPILYEFDNMRLLSIGEYYQNREIGYLGEMLFRVWICHNDVKHKVVSVINIDDVSYKA